MTVVMVTHDTQYLVDTGYVLEENRKSVTLLRELCGSLETDIAKGICAHGSILSDSRGLETYFCDK